MLDAVVRFINDHRIIDNLNLLGEASTGGVAIAMVAAVTNPLLLAALAISHTNSYRLHRRLLRKKNGGTPIN